MFPNMSEEINKENIRRYLDDWSDFDKEISEEGEAYKVIFSSGEKAVILTTPYEVGEFFLSFYINDELYYSDWYEIMDDPLNEFMEYTEVVIKNFLNYEVRIEKKGWWFFKTYELQFIKSGNWYNVLSPET